MNIHMLKVYRSIEVRQKNMELGIVLMGLGEGTRGEKVDEVR